MRNVCCANNCAIASTEGADDFASLIELSLHIEAHNLKVTVDSDCMED